MIISHGRKYIFVHIPKTGGTALALALEARAFMGFTKKKYEQVKYGRR